MNVSVIISNAAIDNICFKHKAPGDEYVILYVRV